MNFSQIEEHTGYLATFSRRKDHASVGLNDTVECSAGLKQWTACAVTQILETSSAHSGDYEVVSVPFPPTVPVSDGGADQAPRFFRIRVSQN